MDYLAEEKAIIWLCACTSYDFPTRVRLLRAAGSPEKLLTAGKEFFFQAVGKDKIGVYIGVYKESEVRLAETEKVVTDAEKKGRFLVTIVSDDYPEALKAIPDPPLLLYGEGNRALLKARKFSIVGSRLIPPWAEKTGRKIAEDLSHRFTIVTGLAEGGDSAAIAGAIESGNLICVLPNGLDECYPASHHHLKEKVKKAGLLLSENAPREKVHKYSFHARNRILAGLSEGVLVLSAAMRSGTLITANFALEYGRDVFALPHNAGTAQGEGCNGLIKKGAYLATDSSDILSVYGMYAEKPIAHNLSPDEKAVLTALKECGELHTAELSERAGLKIYEVAAALSALEMKGLVVRAGGNRYAPL